MRWRVLGGVTVAVMVGAPAAAHAAGGVSWSTELFRERVDPARGYVVRADSAAIAPDGAGVVAWWADRTPALPADARRFLQIVVADGGGRLGAPRTIARRGVPALATASRRGGAILVVWSGGGRLHVALRRRSGAALRTSVVGVDTSSAINALAAIADPRGGWLVVERQYPEHSPHGPGLPYRVRVLRLTSAGTVRDDRRLGLGFFGLYAPAAPAAFDARGRAWIVADGTVNGTAVPSLGTTSVWSAPVAGGFGPGAPVEDRASIGSRVSAGPGTAVAVTWTSTASRGDVAVFGAPRIALGDGTGRLGAPQGPAIDRPRRAFGASAAPLGGAWLLTWQEKPVPAPFSREGAIRAAVLRDGTLGPTRTLVSDPHASGALLEGFVGGRALLRYAVGDTARLALVSDRGPVRPVAGPSWPRLRATARTTARTGGRWVLMTRVDGRGLRTAIARL